MDAGNAIPPETARRLLEAQYRESLAAVTECLFAAAGIGLGQRVLDIGAGSGDTTLIAAQLIGATGRVLAIDPSAEAMESLAAQLRVQPQPLPVVLEVVAAELLALEPGTFDVALARNSVMYFSDPLRALGKIREALRSGGRLVASVYGPLTHEPFHGIPIAAVTSRCPVNEPYPEYVQAFRLGADELQRTLLDAGFRTVERHVVPTARSFPSLAAAIEALRLSRSLAQLLSVLPAGRREDAWLDIAEGFRDHGSASGLRIPGEQVVLIAAK
jgi:SAM-dependent methyltransferase